MGDVRSSRLSTILLWGVIPILSTLYQACIKWLAIELKDVEFGWNWFARALQTPLTLGVVVFEAISFALWLTILSDTSISKAAPITAIAYFLILLMSWTLFHEPVMMLQIVGGVLILAGVWLIGTASATT